MGMIDTIALLWPSDNSPMKLQSKIIPAPDNYKGKPFRVRDLNNIDVQQVSNTLYDKFIQLVNY